MNTKEKMEMSRPQTVKVGVGYGWQKGVKSCRDDQVWTTIRDFFKSASRGMEKPGMLKVDFRRLRASDGDIISSSIFRKIEMADILIFDVAATPKVLQNVRKKRTLNFNCLLELGAALALKKKIFVLSPVGLRKTMPSDLSGILLSEYSMSVKEGKLKREFVDKIGLGNQYRAKLRSVLREKSAKKANEIAD